jgi:uncharacterized protein (TIGR02265 family)
MAPIIDLGLAMTSADPDWDAPLDVEAYMKLVSPAATIKGMFPSVLVAAARRLRVTLPHAQLRFVPFNDYPLRLHMELLVEAAAAFYPHLSTRRGLRKLGHYACGAFLGSTIGKIVFAGIEHPQHVPNAIHGMVRAYEIGTNLGKPFVHVVSIGEREALLQVDGLPSFLDSHHIGVVEGLFRFCGVEGTAIVKASSLTSGEIECRWVSPPSKPSRPSPAPG